MSLVARWIIQDKSLKNSVACYPSAESCGRAARGEADTRRWQWTQYLALSPRCTPPALRLFTVTPLLLSKVFQQFFTNLGEFSDRVRSVLAEASVVCRGEKMKRVLHVHRLQRVQRRSEIRSHAVSQKDTNLLALWVYRQRGRGRRVAGPRHWPARARLRRRWWRHRRRVASAAVATHRQRTTDHTPQTIYFNHIHSQFKLSYSFQHI